MGDLDDRWSLAAYLKARVDPDDHLVHWVSPSGIALCGKVARWEKPASLDERALAEAASCGACAHALGDILSGRALGDSGT